MVREPVAAMVAATILLASALAAGRADAHDDPDIYREYRDLEVVVEAPAVVLTIGLGQNPSDLHVYRGPVRVGSMGWNSTDSMMIGPAYTYCYDDDAFSNECLDFPEHCIDCNGDGHPECDGECRDGQYFEFVDPCVPVIGESEEVEYYLMYDTPGVDMPRHLISRSVTVPRVDSCQAPAVDEDDGYACGCTLHVGLRAYEASSLPTPLVLLVLLAVIARRWRSPAIQEADSPREVAGTVHGTVHGDDELPVIELT